MARSIADEIEAIITPEEAARIEKIPTNNLEAYDYFLKGLEPFQWETREGLEKAIPLFEKAIELDPEFALAHADIALSYAFLDIYQVEKKHSDQIDYYADRALLLDPKLPQSLIAKAMFHNIRGEYELALPYLEKALEYHPNSSRVVSILSDFYTRFMPNTEKYLEFAENDQSIYRGLSLAAYYAYMGDSEKAIEYMDQFSEQEKYPYWYVLFLGMDDPLFDHVDELPAFNKILRKIEVNFWRYNKQIRNSLKEKGLLE